MRTTRTAAVGLAVAVAVTGLSGCGGSSNSAAPGPTSPPRPTTQATITITNPTTNEVTGPTVVVTVKLVGATVVSRSGPPIVANEGHIHISVDGQIVAMAFQESYTLSNLLPGKHSVQADFVASDHFPFANQVRDAVLFAVH